MKGLFRFVSREASGLRKRTDSGSIDFICFATARGTIVDTAAIPPAIRSGQLAGAGIDVLPTEPPEDDDPLVSAWRDVDDPCHDRIVLTPHAAFYCEEGLRDIRVKGAQTCRKALLGQPLRNVVN